MMFNMLFIDWSDNEPMTKSGWEDVLAAFLSSLIWGKLSVLLLKRPQKQFLYVKQFFVDNMKAQDRSG
jgi:hypothetical protein